jgi:hypothetical protein
MINNCSTSLADLIGVNKKNSPVPPGAMTAHMSLGLGFLLPLTTAVSEIANNFALRKKIQWYA